MTARMTIGMVNVPTQPAHLSAAVRAITYSALATPAMVGD